MCVGVVMRISKLEGSEAIGEIYGVTKKIRVDLIEDISIDDYVLIHAGFAIGKVDKKEALERMELLKEVFKL